MTPDEAVRHSLARGREAMIWKLEGLDEYDLRRPLTPTGTNLLGLVKHTASVVAGYFGEVFGRPFDWPMPWFDEGAAPNDDMWVPADESRHSVLDLWDAAWAHVDATLDALPLDATGSVAWWPAQRNPVTLLQIALHVVAEVHHHAGHADIVRELIDGAAGLHPAVPNVPDVDRSWWSDHVARVEGAARVAAGLD